MSKSYVVPFDGKESNLLPHQLQILQHVAWLKIVCPKYKLG